MVQTLVLILMSAPPTASAKAPPPRHELTKGDDGIFRLYFDGRLVAKKDALGNERRFLADGTVEVYERGVLKFSLPALGSE